MWYLPQSISRLYAMFVLSVRVDIDAERGEAMFYPIKTVIACAIVAILVTLSVPLIVQAQEAKTARIGLLGFVQPPARYLQAFRNGLRDHGHVEGKTYVLVPRWGKGDKLALNSPLKKAPLIGFHSTARHNAAKAVLPSSETMGTI